MAIAKTATKRLDSVKRETVESVASAKETNADRRIVESVVFARKTSVLTSANVAQSAQNVRMRSVNRKLNAVMKILVVPAKIAKMELVWTETVELAVIAIL